MELREFIIAQTIITYTFLLYNRNGFTVEMIDNRIESKELSDLIPFVLDIPEFIGEIVMGSKYGFYVRCGDFHGMIDTYTLNDNESIQELIYRAISSYENRWKP